MKHIFNPNKFNIFTKIPDDHDFSITKYNCTDNRYNKNAYKLNCVVRNLCIESWKKIPNVDVHVFTSQDIKDTFVGILENDPFYQLTTATPFDNHIEIIDLEDGIFSSKGYTLPPHKEYCFSTDIIRYKLAKMIPNAIYLDSDIYIFDYLKFLDAIQHSKKDAVILFDTQCFYSKNNIFYNKMISEYDNFTHKYKDKLTFDTTILKLLKQRDKKYFNDNVSENDMFPYLYHFSRAKNYYYNARMLQNLRYKDLKSDYIIIYVRNYYKNKNKINGFISKCKLKHQNKRIIFYLQENDVFNLDRINNELKTVNDYNVYVFDDEDDINRRQLKSDEEIIKMIKFKLNNIFNLNIKDIYIYMIFLSMNKILIMGKFPHYYFSTKNLMKEVR